ncbi:MAG TPA: hypothetical protein VIK93_11730, partial [Limnochordales bacterium]
MGICVIEPGHAAPLLDAVAASCARAGLGPTSLRLERIEVDTARGEWRLYVAAAAGVFTATVAQEVEERLRAMVSGVRRVRLVLAPALTGEAAGEGVLDAPASDPGPKGAASAPHRDDTDQLSGRAGRETARAGGGEEAVDPDAPGPEELTVAGSADWGGWPAGMAEGRGSDAPDGRDDDRDEILDDDYQEYLERLRALAAVAPPVPPSSARNGKANGNGGVNGAKGNGLVLLGKEFSGDPVRLA